MKKTKENVMRFALFVIAALCLTSCGGIKVIPKALNTVNTVTLSELNLGRKDYRILNTVTSEATITCDYGMNTVEIKDENGEFELNYKINGNVWTYDNHKGVMKLGFLARDYSNSDINGGLLYPEDIARRMAIYRLINSVQENGGDGVIEPTISTNVEQVSKKTIIYKATVTGKIIKLKTDN